MGKQSTTVIEPEVLWKTVESENRKKVGILGGTFNPPHIGHLIIADQVRDQLALDHILFLPSANPPHSSGKKTIDAKYRTKMVELAIKDHPRFTLELAEIKRGGKSYTFETMKKLKEKNPDIDYYFIIGGDMVEDLPTWYNIDELALLVQFVAVNRPSYRKETPYPVIWVDVPDISISSTEIRSKISEGCSVNYLLPDEVISYIDNEGLYKNDSAK